MKNIQLETLKLLVFDKSNNEHINVLKELNSDETIRKYFTGFLTKLMNKNNEIYDKGFLLELNDTIIGYIDFSSKDEENSIYLRGAILKEYRKNEYGKLMLEEVTNYTFDNYDEVDKIILNISPKNTASINTSKSCNYIHYKDDYYVSFNPNKTKTR